MLVDKGLEMPPAASPPVRGVGRIFQRFQVQAPQYRLVPFVGDESPHPGCLLRLDMPPMHNHQATPVLLVHRIQTTFQMSSVLAFHFGDGCLNAWIVSIFPIWVIHTSDQSNPARSRPPEETPRTPHSSGRCCRRRAWSLNSTVRWLKSSSRTNLMSIQAT
jgi:hypothetical protein